MKTLNVNVEAWLKIFSLAVIFFVASCCEPEEILAPTVKSVAVKDVTENGATISGAVSFDGGSKIIEKGIYLNGNKMISPSNGNHFEVTVSDLAAGNTYTVKAYATNISGMSYGESLEFTTLIPLEPLPVLEIKSATEVETKSAVLNGLVKEVSTLKDLVVVFEYGLDRNFGSSVQAHLYQNDPAGIIAKAQVESLKEGEIYFYRLKAVNSKNETAFSPSSQFTTLNSPVTFGIPYGEILNVETDKKGDVYIVGVFATEDSKKDAFVAKLDNNSGELLWRYDVVGPHFERPRGGLIAKNGVLYAHMGRDDEYGTGGGRLYVDAYDCESGKMLWSTQVSEGLGQDLTLSSDGLIYSVASIHLTKLDLSGKIVSRFTAQGPYGFGSISLYGNKVLVGGGRVIHEGQESMIWCFDADLNLLWDNPGVSQEGIAYVRSIASFPEKNLIFLGEVKGSPPNAVPIEAFIVCYEVKESGLEFKWKKLFTNSLELHIKKAGDNYYYLYTADGDNEFAKTPKGPALMNIQGDILWTANPKTNGNISIFGNKIYSANRSNVLKIILI